MSKIKKIVIIIILFFIAILINSFSYAVTQEEAGESLAKFAKNFYDNYNKDIILESGHDDEAALGLTVDGKYKFDEWNFVTFMINKCWNLDVKELENFIQADVEYLTDTSDFYDKYTEEKDGKIILKDLTILKPGDICKFASPTYGEYIYIGNEEYIYMYNGSMQKSKIENPQISDIYRISKEKAESINKGNIIEIYDGEYEDEYGRYYGTVEGRYVRFI